jgi:Helix-turn-helix domain
MKKMILMKMNEMIRIQTDLLILLSANKKSPSIATENIEWMDAQDVINFLHISPRTLFRLRQNGQLPFYKLNGKIYYKKTEIEWLLHTHKTV